MKVFSQLQSPNKKYLTTILFISLIFFLIKWITSFYYLNEELLVKILFESVSDGSFYYPLINFFSHFDFSNTLNPLIQDTKNAAFPFGSLILHTLFYKFFGLFGLILVDLFGIFLFLVIFYRIFLFFNSEKNSLFYSLLLFGIPIILNFYFYNFNQLPFIQFKDLFTLRVHRPFPSSIYFFAFIFLILYMHQNNSFQKKYFIFMGILMGLSLSSFYYFFITEVITLFIYIIYKNKKNVLNFITKNYISFILMIFTFLIISMPFLLNMIYVEEDVITSAGVFNLDDEKRFVLLSHYSDKLFNFQFILFNIVTIFFVLYLNLKKLNFYELANIFLIIYLGTLISPFLIIIFSNKISHMYHFNNNIVVYGILLLFVSLVIFINSKKNIKLNFTYLLVFLIFTNLFHEIKAKKVKSLERLEFNKISKIINNKNLNKSNLTLLTYDSRFMIWGMMNKKIDYLNLTYVGSTGKNYNLIENDLINSFMFLKLNSKDFIKFLENRLRGYRYLNENVGIFFRHRYTANSLFTYKNSQDFEPEIKDYILNTSPLYHQQLAIPIDEFVRLENKFNSTKEENFIIPDIIILNNDLSFINKIKIDKSIFCEVFIGNMYRLYVEKNAILECGN